MKKREPKKTAEPADPFKDAKTVNISGDYHFTSEEKQALGMSLAGMYNQREEILAHKKDLMAQINAQAAGVEAQIKGTVNKIRSGFEPRDMEVFVLYNNPTKGTKSFYRTDSRALVSSTIMLPSDFEQELPGMPAPVVVQPPSKTKAKSGGKTSNVPPGGDDGAGMTNLGDALNAAAAGVTLALVPFDADPMDEPKVIARKFTNAAKKAGWPEACIVILRDEVKKIEVAHRAIEILTPHITPTKVDADQAQ